MNHRTLSTPTAVQQAWHDMELGLFIHFNLFTYSGDWQWRSFREHPSPDLFQPERLDTDQWMEAAKAMGARYAVLTAKHCEGFCLWPTDVYDYGVRQSSWRGGKGNVVGDFIRSCHKYGIAPGIYYSPAANSYFKVDNPGLVGPDAPVDQATYQSICERQLRELWSRYGDLAEIWFDGSTLPPEAGGPEIATMLNELQPRASVFQSSCATIRWIGNEDGVAPDPCWATVGDFRTAADGVAKNLGTGDPDGTVWLPGECDVPIRLGQWCWKPNQEHLVFSIDRLMDLYYRSVGHNCNLLLNANPDTSGLIPEPDFTRYAQFGAEIRRRFGQSLAWTAGQGDCIELALPREMQVDHVVLMEDLPRGHRIRQYAVQAKVGRQWQQVAQGSAIGHKKIDRLAPVRCVALRLTVQQSVGVPQVRRFAAYGGNWRAEPVVRRESGNPGRRKRGGQYDDTESPGGGPGRGYPGDSR